MKALAGGYIAGLRTRRLVRACVFDSCAYRGSENSHPLSPKNLTPPPSGVKISYYFMDILSDLSHGFTHSTEFLCMCFWILAVSFGIYWLQIASFTEQYIVEIFSCQYMSMLYPFKTLQCVPYFIYDWIYTSATDWMFVCLNSYCCSVTQSHPTLCNPMECSTPGFPALHHLLEFVQTHVHWVSDVI